MFGQNNAGTMAVQKEMTVPGAPKAFAQVGGKKPFVPFKHGGAKKKPMRFGGVSKAGGLDFDAIMGSK